MAVHIIYQDGFVESHVEGDELWMARHRGGDKDIENPYLIEGHEGHDVFVTVLGGGNFRVQSNGQDITVSKDNFDGTIKRIVYDQ